MGHNAMQSYRLSRNDMYEPSPSFLAVRCAFHISQSTRLVRLTEEKRLGMKKALTASLPSHSSPIYQRFRDTKTLPIFGLTALRW